MSRTSGFGAELIKRLFDKPAVFAFGLRPSVPRVTEPRSDARTATARSEDPFAHAVLQLAALSLSARSLLALRS
jgi:hypothetical protein